MFIHLFIHKCMIYVKTLYAIVFCGFVAKKGESGSNSYLNLKVDA